MMMVMDGWWICVKFAENRISIGNEDGRMNLRRSVEIEEDGWSLEKESRLRVDCSIGCSCRPLLMGMDRFTY